MSYRSGIVGRVIETYVLPGEDVHPEGITADPDGFTFYVSSAKQGTILRGRLGEERLEIWQQPGADGRDHALGMTVDPHGRLLVCGYHTGYLWAYDTVTGDLVARRKVPADRTLLNDVCVAGDHAYVTDSTRPVLWRYPLEKEDVGEPEEWIDLGEAEADSYLNGIVALHGDATLLVAAQGTEVLWRIDIETRQVHRLETRVAADGMVVVGDRLYTCDNVEQPDGEVAFYVSEFELDDDARHAHLVRRWPLSKDDTPTTLAHLGGRLLVVNSQFIPGREGRARAPFTVGVIQP
jgi:sugar lactone lactonase YvrE